MQLAMEKKASVLRASGQNVEKKDVYGRDLLTLLIKANIVIDIPENQRLMDKDVLERECYSPSSFIANEADVLQLVPNNHLVTQSTFNDLCTPAPMGFSSSL
jgi:hypothetical protein